jgi:hypothetical protein
VERDQRVGELPLEAHDLLPVLLQSGSRAAIAKVLPLMQKPPKKILEGLYRERMPTRGRGGRRG